MGKKLFYFFIAALFLIGASSLYLIKSPSEILNSWGYCAFCNEDVVDRQKFYEDDLIMALYTHKPILPGHCLIIPKRHVERFELLTDEELMQTGSVIKKVNLVASNLFNTSSYLILQKNGMEAGQTVPHVHFHYIPRQKGDDSVLKFFAKMYIANAQPPLSTIKMQEITAEMNRAINEIE
ncbi:MAG: HIT family protein [Chlamydia sp.]